MENYNPKIIILTAARIDRLRCERGYSIRVLAQKAGISKTTLQEIIQGIKIPNIHTVYLISKALGVTLSDLFIEDENHLNLRSKEAILIKIFREVSPMSQDTLIKVAKCMK